MYIKLTKLQASTDALFPPGDKNEYRYGDLNSDVSLPVDYTLTGELLNDITVGEPMRVLRTSRNGVNMPGLFYSSPVKAIQGNTIITGNSVYLLSYE